MQISEKLKEYLRPITGISHSYILGISQVYIRHYLSCVEDKSQVYLRQITYKSQEVNHGTGCVLRELLNIQVGLFQMLINHSYLWVSKHKTCNTRQ